MVAVKSFEADRFISRPPDHIIIYLLFGSDAGLVSERRNSLLKYTVSDTTDPFQLIRLTGDEIASDNLRLIDEANSISMFGGKRTIYIELGIKNIIPAIEDILAAPPGDCIIIIEAGNLKRESLIRKLLEREKNCAAIECYSDSPKEVENLIQQSLSNEKISIEPEALRHLSHMLGVDRLTTRSEISKLLTYTYGQTRIELCDIENIVANAATIATESIINDAFSGRVEELDKNLARALASGIDTNFLYSSILRYAIALHRSLTEFRAGVAIDQLIFGMSRQGIFIKKEPLQEQIRLWTVERLTATLSEILDALSKARRETKISEILAVRTLWSIARAANSKRVSSSLKTSA